MFQIIFVWNLYQTQAVSYTEVKESDKLFIKHSALTPSLMKYDGMGDL